MRKQRDWFGDKLNVILFALVVVTLTGLLVGEYVYFSSMQRSLWGLSVSNTLELSEQGAHAFEIFIDQGYAMLEGRAGNFAQYASDDEAAIGAKLDLYEDGDPNFVVIDLERGVMYFNSAEKLTLSEEQLAVYRDLPDNGVLEPYLNEHTGLSCLGYYERFTFADGVPGLVRKGYPISEAEHEFSISFFEDTGFSYVVNAEGDIILRPRSKNSNRTYANIFDVIDLEGNDADAVETFRTSMTDGKQGVMRFQFAGEEAIFAFTPLGDTAGWYIVSIIPNASITEQTENILRTSQTFILLMAVALLILAAFILTLLQFHRKNRAKDVELQYRDQLFNILANNTDDVFLMMSAQDSQVIYVSPNVERVTGVPRERVMEDLSSLQSVIHSSGEEFGLERMQAIPLGESVCVEGECFHAKTSELRWFVETVYHVAIDNLDRFIVVLSDCTANRKKEAALSEALEVARTANASKSTFLSNMSHDIRTPMNAIVGLATLLQRDADRPDKVREHTRKIIASSQHLLDLINNVLDMSKIESGKTTLNIGEFDLADIVYELNTIVQPQARAKNQTYEVSVVDLKTERVLGDKLRLNQVLVNILSNAVKYTPAGGTIQFTLRQLPQITRGFVRLSFTVADNGIGMSEEYLDKIFQPFSRMEDSTTSGIQGTGLGMAITQNLVNLMGGAIFVQSEQGVGSTFSVELELRTREDAWDDFWTENGVSRLLVVNADENACMGVKTAMEGTGVTVLTALSGQSAVQMAALAHREGADFDCVLLDWELPGMGGREAARRLREVLPADAPIIALTGCDGSESEEETEDAGVSGVLSKPFFLSSFRHVLSSLRPGEGAARAAETDAPVLKGRHFLAAEDNELNAEILTELLDMESATCEVQPNGKATLERFQASAPGEFDAILMDVQMPVMNGYEATRAIRACARPDAGRIPIIAMTANAFVDDVNEALNAGMNAHVSKPVDMESLKKTLADILRR